MGKVPRTQWVRDKLERLQQLNVIPGDGSLSPVSGVLLACWSTGGNAHNRERRPGGIGNRLPSEREFPACTMTATDRSRTGWQSS